MNATSENHMGRGRVSENQCQYLPERGSEATMMDVCNNTY